MRLLFDDLSLWAKESPLALWALGLWGALETIVWFILPDYLLLILVTLAPTRYKQWLIYSALGSTLGLIAMFYLCLLQPGWVSSWLFHLPFTHSDMLERIVNMEPSNDLILVFLQPFSGIPSKVWVYSEVRYWFWDAVPFLSVMALGRAMRMSLVVLCGLGVQRFFPVLLKKYWLPIWILYTALFLYGLCRTSV